MREVGALLDAKAAHPGLKCRDHLTGLAQSNGIPKQRVDEVLALTGLGSVAGRRIRGLSLGMSQRLGLAAAMLGDPGHLMSEMALTADATTRAFIQQSSVRVRSPKQDQLAAALAAAGHEVRQVDGFLEVTGLSTDEVGAIAWKAKAPVYALHEEHASLEEAFMELTRDSVEYHAGVPGQPVVPPVPGGGA